MYLKIKLCALILLTGISSTFAQQIFGATYDITMPLSETKEFTDKTSFLGFGAIGRFYVNPNTTIGFTMGWDFIEQTTEDPIFINDKWIYGKQERSTNILPILANAHYYINHSYDTQSYFGINGGLYYIERRLKINSKKEYDTNLHLGFAPEVGVITKLPSGLKGLLSIKYNYALKRKGSIAHSFVNINLGLILSSSIL